MKAIIKKKAVPFLSVLFSACMLLSVSLIKKENVIAQNVTKTCITLDAANAVTMGSSAPSYIFYDKDGSGTMNTGEAYIYCNNRFNPGASDDAVLWWSAPSGGGVSQLSATINLNNAANRALSDNTDGIRWAALKVSGENECVSLSAEFWNFLEFKDKEKTTATLNFEEIALQRDDNVAIVINCGENGKNNYDEATISADITFTPEQGEQAVYTFGGSTVLTAHGNALNGGTGYTLGEAATEYFSWGTATFSSRGEITADTDKTGLTQSGVMEGKGERELLSKGNGQWNIDGVSASYHVAVTGSVAKIHAPTNLHDTQLVWKAPADGVFSLDKLELYMGDTSGSAESDGMKYAVLYKDSEGNYYDLYRENQIENAAPWHSLIWQAEKTYVTAVPDIAMSAGEEFIVMFNRNANATLDPCQFNITIGFYTQADGIKQYTIEQSSSKFEEQGTNNFYFRDVFTHAAVNYKKSDGSILYTDNTCFGSYALKGAEVVSLGENQIFVGWRKGANGTLYKAGASLGVTVTELDFIAVIIRVKMYEAAGLRLSTELGDAGLRFVSEYDLSELKSSEYSSFGTIIAPTDTITDESVFVKGGDLTVADVPAVNYKTEGNTFTQHAVLTNIKTANYNRAMSAKGYVTVTLSDGKVSEAQTFYSADTAEKSVAYVAYNLYDWFTQTFAGAPEYDELHAVILAYKEAYAENI